MPAAGSQSVGMKDTGRVEILQQLDLETGRFEQARGKCRSYRAPCGRPRRDRFRRRAPIQCSLDRGESRRGRRRADSRRVSESASNDGPRTQPCSGVRCSQTCSARMASIEFSAKERRPVPLVEDVEDADVGGIQPASKIPEAPRTIRKGVASRASVLSRRAPRKRTKSVARGTDQTADHRNIVRQRQATACPTL